MFSAKSLSLALIIAILKIPPFIYNFSLIVTRTKTRLEIYAYGDNFYLADFNRVCSIYFASALVDASRTKSGRKSLPQYNLFNFSKVRRN
jgi:hypothetical protein